MLDVKVAINMQGGVFLPTKEFVYPGWKTSILCQSMSFEDWWDCQEDLLKHGLNVELGVFDGDSLVGLTVLTEAVDAHVGPHMMLFLQYMDPEYRHRDNAWRRVIKSAIAVTKELGFTYLSWTHMKTQHRFLVTYKRVN